MRMSTKVYYYVRSINQSRLKNNAICLTLYPGAWNSSGWPESSNSNSKKTLSHPSSGALLGPEIDLLDPTPRGDMK